MRDERGTGALALAGENVDDAGREAGLANQFAQAQSRQRRLLGRLQDTGATDGEGRCEFPGGHQQREIPRHDLRNDSHGLAGHVGVKFGAGDADRCLHRGALDLGRPAGHVAKITGGPRDIDHAGDLPRLALIDALDLGKLRRVLIDEAGQLPQQRLTAGRQHVGPRSGRERRTRSGHGAIDIFRSRVGDSADFPARGRIEHLDGFAGLCIHPFIVDEQSRLQREEFIDGGRGGGLRGNGVGAEFCVHGTSPRMV